MLSTVEKVLFLKSIELFSQIPGEDLARVALIASEEAREGGEESFAEGEDGDALYLVLDGKVRVHREDRVIAIEPAQLLKISREDFQEIVGEKPEIAMGIIKVLTRRLRTAIR